MEAFDSSKDYKRLHIEWVKANKSFRPRTPPPLTFNSYLEYLIDVYAFTIKQQMTAFIWLKDDYNWSKKSKSINEEVAKMFDADHLPNYDNTFFVTIGFNEQKFNPPAVLKALNKLFEKDWITSAYGVFEYYSEKGQHPHLMMRLQVIESIFKKGKGKIADKIMDSCLGKFFDGRNYVDVKFWLPCHQPYIELNKCSEKKEFLEKDVLWRIENNLPAFVEKK